MHSRQISFFLTASDQAQLLRQLRDAADFVVIDSRAELGQIRLLEEAEVGEIGVGRLLVYLTRSNYHEAIRLIPLRNQNFQAIDDLRSPVVQFARCGHADHQLRRGCLYVATAYYENGALSRKDGSFLKWARVLIETTRKKLRRDSKVGSYFGEDALRLKQAGAKLLL